MNPRVALGIGVTFLFVAVVFYVVPLVFGGYVDYAGLTMLLVLSIAMTLLFYVLIASTPRGQ